MAHLLRQARLLRHREGGSRVRSEFSRDPAATRPNTEADRTTQWVASLSSPCRQNPVSRLRVPAVRYGSKSFFGKGSFFAYVQTALASIYCKSLRLLVTWKRNRGNRAGATTKCSTLRAGPPEIAKTRITCSAGTAITRARGPEALLRGDIPGTRRRKFAGDGGHGVPGVHAPRVRRGRW